MSWIVECARLTTKVVRNVPVASSVYHAVRHRAIAPVLADLSDDLLEFVRRSRSPRKKDSGQRFCEYSRNAWCALTNLPRTAVHVTLKVIHERQRGPRKLLTVGRSNVNRTLDTDAGNRGFRLEANSAFAALTGVSDPRQDWGRQYPCFSCDCLGKERGYANDRANWSDDYNATVVLPVPTFQNPTGPMSIVGFITLDARGKLYRMLPNVFDLHRSGRDPHEAYAHLAEYKFGRMLAHMAGMLIDSWEG